MVTLTDAAAAKLREMIEGRPADESVLRLFVKPGGCTGFSYGMALDAPQETDEVFHIKGVQVVVDKPSMELIDGSQVDYKEDFDSQGFRIWNPNATSTCGCGSSFRTATEAGQPGCCE